MRHAQNRFELRHLCFVFLIQLQPRGRNRWWRELKSVKCHSPTELLLRSGRNRKRSCSNYLNHQLYNVFPLVCFYSPQINNILRAVQADPVWSWSDCRVSNHCSKSVKGNEFANRGGNNEERFLCSWLHRLCCWAGRSLASRRSSTSEALKNHRNGSVRTSESLQRSNHTFVSNRLE